jgi:hypothetical protein
VGLKWPAFFIAPRVQEHLAIVEMLGIELQRLMKSLLLGWSPTARPPFLRRKDGLGCVDGEASG